MTKELGLESLYDRLKAELPMLDPEEFREVFAEAVRDDPKLATEVVSWARKRFGN